MIICLEMAVVKYIKVLSVVLISGINPLRHKLLQCGISAFSDWLPCQALNSFYKALVSKEGSESISVNNSNANIFVFFFASRSVESSSVPSG